MPPKIRCPECFKNAAGANCGSCGFDFDTSIGIHDLRTDKSFDTLLDVDAYDEQHKVIAMNQVLANCYFDMMTQAGRVPKGDILEIASGSGHLTVPLVASGQFDSVNASDISPNFMKILDKKLTALKPKTEVNQYLFDANSFPFQAAQFDFVVGNSVLHHFANFENSIQEAQRVLRPGGIAIFGEPIMDTHAFSSLAAGLILRFANASKTYALDKKTRQILEAVQNIATKKMDHLNSDRSDLDHIEDKFQFPLNYLRNLAAELGFSKFITQPCPPNFQLGERIKLKMTEIFSYTKASPEFLNDFDFIFEAFTEDYGDPLKGQIHPLFSLFAFEK